MKLGLFAPNVGAGASAAQARATAVLAEELGGAEEVEIADPLTWLAFAAAVTRDIKLGTGVIVLPQRNPVVLAKQAATLDVLSEGRLLLGVGVGWLAEEFDAVGVSFADRGRRHDDYVEAMRALWRDTQASVHNTYTNFDNAISLPQPPVTPQPSIGSSWSCSSSPS
jgi:probable F420-dependent oxidoreductase